ncbi:MAG: hypothetical protein ACOC33_02205 [bacterium]
MKFFNYYFIESHRDIPRRDIPFGEFSQNEFKIFKSEILSSLDELDKSFYSEYKVYLWEDIEQKKKEYDIFSSYAHQIFNNSLNTLTDIETTDINVQFPEDLTEKLISFLEKSIDKSFGQMKILSFSKEELSIILSTSSKFGNLIENVTIVFEPTFWQNGKPVPSTIYADDADWNSDVPEEIKEDYYEYLLQSLIGTETLEKISIITPTGKVSDSEQIDNPKILGFSIEDGIKTRFYPNLNLDGDIKIAGGKKSFRTTNRPEQDVDTNLRNIYSVLFQELPSTSDIKKMKSFSGVLELISKLDKDVVDNILTRFSSYLWGDDAEIYSGEKDESGINKEDLEIKMAIYNEFIKYHPNVKYDDEYLDDRIRNFYQEH